MMGPALFELYTNTTPSLPSAAKKNASANVAADDLNHHDHPKLAKTDSVASTSTFKDFFSRNSKGAKPDMSTSAALSSMSRPQKAMSLDQTTSSHLRDQLKQFPQPLRSYRVKYVGRTLLDRRYTLPMLQWIIADIKRNAATTSSPYQKARDIYLQVTDVALKATTVQENRLLFVHPLQTINKFTQTNQDKSCFTYLTRDHQDAQFTCHVFQASDESVVSAPLIQSVHPIQLVVAESRTHTQHTYTHIHTITLTHTLSTAFV